MCLLITSTASAMRRALLETPSMIETIYGSNSDGVGIMYPTTSGIKVVKSLPKNAEQARKFLARLPNDERQVAVHWRMRTHGDINLEQCHPYQVSEQTWLMHNGVLSTGNKADPSKSDTWHFIKAYLSDAGDDTLHDPAFVRMLGEFIDSNRFAIMSGDGRLTVVNRDQGIEHDGVWFSNTYAWEPSQFIPGYRSSAFSGWSRYRWVDDEPVGRVSRAWSVDAVDAAIYDCDAFSLACQLDKSPLAVVDYIVSNYIINPTDGFDPADHGPLVGGLVRAWSSYADDTLVAAIDAGHDEQVAEALLYFCDLSLEDEETPLQAAHAVIGSPH